MKNRIKMLIIALSMVIGAQSNTQASKPQTIELNKTNIEKLMNIGIAVFGSVCLIQFCYKMFNCITKTSSQKKNTVKPLKQEKKVEKKKESSTDEEDLPYNKIN